MCNSWPTKYTHTHTHIYCIWKWSIKKVRIFVYEEFFIHIHILMKSAGELPGNGSDLTAFSKLKIKHSASGADSPGSISLIIYLDFKWRKKKKTNQPLWQQFFFPTSNNKKVFDIIRSQKLIKSSPAEKKSEGTSELQTGTPGGLRLRSEGRHQSIQAAHLSHKTFFVELNSFKHRRTPFFTWTKILKCVIYSLLPQFLYKILAAESFPNVKKYQHLHTFRVFF